MALLSFGVLRGCSLYRIDHAVKGVQVKQTRICGAPGLNSGNKLCPEIAQGKYFFAADSQYAVSGLVASRGTAFLNGHRNAVASRLPSVSDFSLPLRFPLLKHSQFECRLSGHQSEAGHLAWDSFQRSELP